MWAMAAKPCRSALQLAIALPAAVRGPLLLRLLRRFGAQFPSRCFTKVNRLAKHTSERTSIRGHDHPRGLIPRELTGQVRLNDSTWGLLLSFGFRGLAKAYSLKS